MGAWHVLDIGAMLAAAVAPLVNRNALAVVEYLNAALGRAGINLLADQFMRHRIEKPADLDVIIQRDPCQTPFGEFIVGRWQRRERWALNRLLEMPPTDTNTAHDIVVDPIDHTGDRLVGFGQ